MGVCGSHSSAEQVAEYNTSRKIDQENYQHYASEATKLKLLLLGAGESGKSTIFKQMKIIYGEGFSEAQKLASRRYIWGNIIEAMQVLCEAVRTLGWIDRLAAKEQYELVIRIEGTPLEFSSQLGQAVKRLWLDQVMQEAWELRSQFQVIDSAYQFLQRIDEISQPEYVPSVEDILRSRVRTTGIVEETFVMRKHTFVFFDVGGQRNERKKWLSCFSEVHAVIFVAALSEYDQRLFEDEHTNRMVEAIALFDEICNSKWFKSTAMILFLNKSDLYAEKIKVVTIQSVPEFADYTGTPNDYTDGVAYFSSKFLAVNKNPRKDIYQHVTCAMDTSHMTVVMDACKEIIIKIHLQNTGFAD